MFCSKCGKELPDDAQFCLKCGNSLAASKPAKSATGWIALVAVMVAVAIAAAGYKLLPHSAPAPATAALNSVAPQDARTPFEETMKQATTPEVTPEPPPVPKTLSPQDIFQMASGGVTLIEVFDDEGHKRGQGSGFVVSSDGMTLTNYHVIRGAARATAKFADGTTSDVNGVVSYDAVRDVAVITLVSPAKTVLELGDSDSVQVGAKLVAIGSPLGFQNTLSEGIVSGVRDGRIQMSDPISPGSSGGAVFDSYGKVVGISVSTVAQGQNLNFAVPIDWAKPYLNGGTPRTLAEVAAENTVIQDVLNGSVTIPAGHVTSWNITVNPNVMSDAEVHGQVSSTGGMDGKITLALQNRPIYACRETACAIHQDISFPGSYALLLDNRISPVFGRTVTGQISLRYVK